MQSQQTPVPTLHICIYLYLTPEKLFENDLWYKDDLQAQDDEIFVSSSNVYFYWL